MDGMQGENAELRKCKPVIEIYTRKHSIWVWSITAVIWISLLPTTNS